MALYHSKSANLSLGIRSAYYKEVEGKKTLVPGIRVTFEGGMYETNDPELIELLEKRSEFGPGRHFIRIPDGTDEKQLKEITKSQEQKDKELEDLRKQNEELRKKLTEKEAGKEEKATVDDGPMEGWSRARLVEEANKYNIEPSKYRVGIKNSDIAAAIIEARSAQEEGGGARFND